MALTGQGLGFDHWIGVMISNTEKSLLTGHNRYLYSGQLREAGWPIYESITKPRTTSTKAISVPFVTEVSDQILDLNIKTIICNIIIPAGAWVLQRQDRF